MTEKNENREIETAEAATPGASPATSRRKFLKGAGATAMAAVAGVASLAIASDAVAIESGAIEPTDAQAAAFAALPFDGPITMLNMLKFKPDGGLAKYMQYGAAAGPLVAKVGGKTIFMGQAKSLLIGNDEWDMVFIVEYPEKANLPQLLMMPEYQAVAHLRHEALENSVLLAMQQMPSGLG